jgi:hypothetical protein
MAFDLWNFVGGLITGGLGGALLTFKFTRTSTSSGGGNTVDQSRARAGGDIIGRDKH